MCLVVNRFRHWRLKPKIARKDIKCYKILQISSSPSTANYFILVTPFQRKRINLHDKTFQSTLFDNTPIKDSHVYIVNIGIHSYQSRYLAKKLISTDAWSSKHYICLPAYIPKGTKYWIGKRGEYCSEKIVFDI